MDYQYSYDFDSEIQVTDLELRHCGENETLVRGTVTLPKGGAYVLLYSARLLLLELNGAPVGDQTRSLWYGKRCGRSGVEFRTAPGKNTLTLRFSGKLSAEALVLSLAPGFSASAAVPPLSKSFTPPEPPVIPPAPSPAEVPAWSPGAGHGPSPGRFGFTRGDGVLDCAMTAFGLVDKLYLCGHPRYDKPYRWGYCVLPGDEKALYTWDAIEVNQLAVKWESQGVKLHYSLGSPGIVTECDSRDMRLSQLEFAGGSCNDLHYLISLCWFRV